MQNSPAETQLIRVLSVRQPYADMIIYGDKWNELRSWKTPYRGSIYIHASRWLGRPESVGPGVTGAIIGRVHLVGCVEGARLRPIAMNANYGHKMDKSLKPLAEYLSPLTNEAWSNDITDEWNWILAEPVPLKNPIPAKGKLNLWKAEYPADLLKCGRSAKGTAKLSATGFPE